MQANIERADDSPLPGQDAVTVPVQRAPLDDSTDEYPAVPEGVPAPVGDPGQPAADPAAAEPEAAGADVVDADAGSDPGAVPVDDTIGDTDLLAPQGDADAASTSDAAGDGPGTLSIEDAPAGDAGVADAGPGVADEPGDGPEAIDE